MDSKERSEKIELYGRGYDLLKAEQSNIPLRHEFYTLSVKKFIIGRILFEME